MYQQHSSLRWMTWHLHFQKNQSDEGIKYPYPQIKFSSYCMILLMCILIFTFFQGLLWEVVGLMRLEICFWLFDFWFWFCFLFEAISAFFLCCGSFNVLGFGEFEASITVFCCLVEFLWIVCGWIMLLID